MKHSLPRFGDCSGCGVCVDICPKSALRQVVDGNGFLRIITDPSLCIGCKRCEKACPCLSEAGTPVRSLEKAVPYASWSINKDIRECGASGGIFAQIGLNILVAGNGVVAGAAWFPGNHVRHITAESPEQIRSLQGAKYMQSDTKGIYNRTYEYLMQGATVLFSGTPCQCAGLYGYLSGKKYKGILYTAEVICHGVPSRDISLWGIEDNNATDIVAYRTKSRGWPHSQRMVYNKEGRKIEIQGRSDDFFYRVFSGDTALRPYCYKCRFARMPRVADITLGDYWGVQSVPEQMDQGVSLLIVNSEKGEELLAKYGNYLVYEKTSFADCLPFNYPLYTNARMLRYLSLSGAIGKLRREHPDIGKDLLRIDPADKLTTRIFYIYTAILRKAHRRWVDKKMNILMKKLK